MDKKKNVKGLKISKISGIDMATVYVDQLENNLIFGFRNKEDESFYSTGIAIEKRQTIMKGRLIYSLGGKVYLFHHDKLDKLFGENVKEKEKIAEEIFNKKTGKIKLNYDIIKNPKKQLFEKKFKEYLLRNLDKLNDDEIIKVFNKIDNNEFDNLDVSLEIDGIKKDEKYILENLNKKFVRHSELAKLFEVEGDQKTIFTLYYAQNKGNIFNIVSDNLNLEIGVVYPITKNKKKGKNW